jgi:hypothetical protein
VPVSVVPPPLSLELLQAAVKAIEASARKRVCVRMA